MVSFKGDLCFYTVAVDDQTCERWSEFLKGPLLDHNKKCETNLVCNNNDIELEIIYKSNVDFPEQLHNGALII